MDSEPTGPTSYTEAAQVKPQERDYRLKLTNERWPYRVQGIPSDWRREPELGRLRRTIELPPSKQQRTDAAGEPLTELEEFVLRFPSAPVHGMQRVHVYHGHRSASLQMHTYRVLKASSKQPITRIFLIHNGLNEIDKLGFYHDLASYLIESDRGVACVLRPFPGHLTRAPYAPHFAETPLQRYLWDGSHLFQQFVRYMIETRWFLSALAPHREAGTATGAGLLRGHAGRGEAEMTIPRQIEGEFLAMNKASETALKEIREEQQDAREPEAPPSDTTFKSAIESLQELFVPDTSTSRKSAPAPRPSLHALGYSIGGFAAQSIFMSWPSLISSCSTLLSGGALRELTPTAFADPEEWQTVLHSLRYELDDWLLRRSLDADGRVAGISQSLFHNFQRTFYEVFQQDYRGSHRTRLAAFRRRMLFIVGGDDPVVRPKSVLESGPPGGSNLVQIGGIGHFLGSRAKGAEEGQQRRFWLPEVGRLMYRFSIEADEQLSDERNEVSANSTAEPKAGAGVKQPTLERLRDHEILDIPQDGALSKDLFERCVDDMLARAEQQPHSRLIITRNEIPAVLLDDEAVRDRARAFHHDDLSIERYCRRVALWRKAVLKCAGRTKIVLPWNAEQIVEHLDPGHGFPSQSETAAGYLRLDGRTEAVWKSYLTMADRLETATRGNRANGAISIFNGKSDLRANHGTSDVAKALMEQQRERLGDTKLSVPSLPDCWVWLSADFFGLAENAPQLSAKDATDHFIDRVTSLHPAPATAEGSATERPPLDLGTALRDGEIRVIMVSRARYNPRYRGKLVVNTGAVRQILTHVALCLACASNYRISRQAR
jgi:hypothetical protein